MPGSAGGRTVRRYGGHEHGAQGAAHWSASHRTTSGTDLAPGKLDRERGQVLFASVLQADIRLVGERAGEEAVVGAVRCGAASSLRGHSLNCTLPLGEDVCASNQSVPAWPSHRPPTFGRRVALPPVFHLKRGQLARQHRRQRHDPPRLPLPSVLRDQPSKGTLDGQGSLHLSANSVAPHTLHVHSGLDLPRPPQQLGAEARHRRGRVRGQRTTRRICAASAIKAHLGLGL